MITEIHKHVDARAVQWRMQRYDLECGADIARYVARERYAWPGGYELFAIADDSGVLCNDCCRTEYALIARSNPRDGWRIIAIDSTADCDTDDVICDHCGRTIYEPETE